MKLRFNPESLQVLEAVRDLKPEGHKVYLVGGAVRDLLVGRPLKDLDFTMPAGSIALAQAVRQRLRGVGFTLDDERQTARVILQRGKPQETVLDFVSFSGGDLLADLQSRDFTVNAICIDLDDLETLTDPLGGQKDLEAGILRQASAQSLGLDPLRAVRGVRMQRDYGLQPEPATAKAMAKAAPALQAVSGERQRDELLKILALPGLVESVRALDAYGLLAAICPQIEILKTLPAVPPHIHTLWEHTLRLLDYQEAIISYLLGRPQSTQLYRLPDVLELIKPWRQELLNHFMQPLQAGRPRYLFFYLAGLYHDLGKPGSQGRKPDGRPHFHRHPQLGTTMVSALSEALLLGREEALYLEKLVAHHMRVHLLSYGGAEISNRAVYRYYKDLDSVGVDVALMSLGDTLAGLGETIAPDQWQNELNAVQRMLEAWYQSPAQLVKPTKLLSGFDLMRSFNLEPSPVLGKVLEAVREAQVMGQVSTKDQALALAAELLKDSKRSPNAH